MKYYSEKLRRLYDTEAELTKAEGLAAKVEAEKAAKEKAAKEHRAERAKEVEEALKAAETAKAKANKLMSAFVNDYGSFHTSYTLKDVNTDSAGTVNNVFDDFITQVFSFLGKE